MAGKDNCKHLRYYGSYCGYELGIADMEEAIDTYKQLLEYDYGLYKYEMERIKKTKDFSSYPLKQQLKYAKSRFPFDDNLWDYFHMEDCLLEFDYCPLCGKPLKKGFLKNFFKKELNDYRNSFEEIYIDTTLIKNLADNKKTKSLIGYVYLVKLDKHYKIGISKTPEQRLKEFTMLPYKLEDIKIARVNEYEKIEKELHEEYKTKKVRGEWFELNESEVEEIVEYLTAIEL